MKKPTSSKKAGKGIKVDFTGVSTEGGGVHIPEGSYLARPIEASKETSGSSHEDYISWVFQITEGKCKGTKLYDNTSLQQQSLWRLRRSLEAMGVETPDGPYDLDLDAIVEDKDIVVAIDVEDDKYQGKLKSKIVAVMSPEDASAGDTEVDGEVDFSEMDSDALEEFAEENGLDVDLSKLKTTAKKRAAVEEAYESAKGSDGDGGVSEGDQLTEEEINGMDDDELAEVVETYDLDVKLEKLATLKKKRVAVWEALEEKQEGGTEEAAGGDITEDSINEMGTDELEEFIKEHKLKVKLDGTTRKKRRTVITAAKEKGLIEE